MYHERKSPAPFNDAPWQPSAKVMSVVGAPKAASKAARLRKEILREHKSLGQWNIKKMARYVAAGGKVKRPAAAAA
jgi:hypothetical protein